MPPLDTVKALAAATYGMATAIAAFVAAQVDISGVVDNAERIVGGGLILVAGGFLFRWLLVGYGGLIDELQEENARKAARISQLEETIEVLRGEKPDRRIGE